MYNVDRKWEIALTLDVSFLKKAIFLHIVITYQDGMRSVADTGFDLGVGGRKSLKVLKVEVKVIFSVVWQYFYYNYAYN